MVTTSDLAEAKARVQELELAAGQENIALHQALKLLENTRRYFHERLEMLLIPWKVLN
jgi:hypothetical protein